jgi:RNA recognition motif-containing protein
MNGMQLGHKRIKVSFARPPSDDIKDTNLFVTGLSPEITETELEEMFSPHGVIVHLRVLRDRETKETRGVAFVRLSKDLSC